MRLYPLLLVPILLAGPGLARAGETPASAETRPTEPIHATPLGGVSVHASAIDIAPVQGTSTRVDRSALARHNTVGAADILNYLPNLTLRKRYEGDTNAILGGRAAGTLQSARTLVYADGLLLSDFLGSGWNNAPRWGMVASGDIASIDVLYGPYSALYPGNSMGTTVVFHTRLPERFQASAKAQAFVQSFADDHGGSNDYRGRTLAAALGNRHGRWRWRVAVSSLDSHSQPMSYIHARAGGDALAAHPATGAHADLGPTGQTRLLVGPTDMNHTRQQQASVRVGYDLGATTHALLTLGWWRNHATSHARSTLRDAAGKPVYAGPVRVDGQVWTLTARDFAPKDENDNHRLLGLELRGRLGQDWHWDATVSDYAIVQARSARAALPPALAAADPSGRVSDQSGSGWRTLDLRLQGPVGNASMWWVGAHLDRYTLHSRAWSTSVWPGPVDGPRTAGFDGRTQTAALYVQAEWNWSLDWTGTLGLRAERWRAFDGRRAGAGAWAAYPDSRASALSPKAAIAWQLAPDWQLRASLAKAVRFPTVGELFQGTLDGTAAIIHNNPDLQPERDWAKDLTLRHSLARGYWRVSLFQADIRNSLYKQTDVTVTPQVTSIQNLDRLRLRGLEVAFKLHDLLPGLDLSGSMAWNASQILRDRRYPAAEGKDVPRMPRTRGSLSANWRFAQGWNLSLALRHSGHQFSRLDNTDHHATFGAITPYTMADAQLGWRFAPGWRATLGVNNLTDRQAWVYHPWPGRTWLAGLQWELPD